MSEVPRVLVKDTDLLSAKSLLQLLSDSVAGMKRQVKENKELTDTNRIAISGAIEALTDLHNSVLTQLHDTRESESFENSDDDHGGRFDA